MHPQNETTREELFVQHYIDELEIEIERMKRTEVQNQFGLESMTFDPDQGLYNDPDDLGFVIDSHDRIFTHILRNITAYEKYVPKERLTRYFELMKELDVQINRFDPDYPLIR